MRYLYEGDLAVVIDPKTPFYGKIVGVEEEQKNDVVLVKVVSTGASFTVERKRISYVDLGTVLSEGIEVA